MSIELASAYVSLIPSASGIAAGIAQEMGGPVQAAAEEAGGKASKSFGDKFTGGLKAVGAAGAAVLTAGLAAGAGLAAIGSSFDDAFDSIRIQTGKTGASLDGLEGSFRNVVKNVPVDFAQASTAIGGLSQKLGLTGGDLEATATQVLNLSRITKTDLATNVAASAGVLNSWGISIDDQGERLDQLFRISQQTGISVSDLAQQMTDGGAQFRAAGLSFEESGALLGTLAKNGLSASDVLPALSKAMAQAAKDGVPAAQVFKDTFAAIKNAPDDVAAGGIAFDVFGAKAGPKFAQLIREGKLGYEEFAATVANGGDTINDAAKDTDDWHEKLKLLTNKALLYLEPIASRVFDGITKAVQFVTPYVQDVAAWLGERLPGAIAVVRGFIVDKLVPAFMVVVDWVVAHWPQMQAVAVAVFDKIREGIAFFVDEIVPRAVAGFKLVFGWLMDNKEVLIGVAAAIAVGLVALFVSWAAGAATAAAATIAAAAPFIAIGLAIAGVVAGVLYAYNHFKLFHDIVDKVGRAIKTATSWLMDHKVVLVAVAAAIALIVAPIPALVAGIIYAWTHFETFRDVVLAVVNAVKVAIAAVADWISDHWEQIKNDTINVFNVVKTVVMVTFEIVRGIIEAAIATIQFIWDNFGTYIITAVQIAWNYVSSIVQAGVDIVVGIFDFFKDLFTGKWGKLWGDVRDILFGVWEAIKAVVQAAIDSTILILEVAWTTIKLAVSAAWDGIKALFPLIWDGIKAVFQLAIDGIKALLQLAWDGIKAAIGLVWDGIKLYFTLWWDVLKLVFQSAVDAIKLVLSTAWDVIKSGASAVWDGIKTVASAVWDAIKTAITAPIDAAKAVLSGLWNEIKSAASDTWHTIKDVADTVWGLIKTAVTLPIDGIKAVIATVSEVAGKIWDGMETAASKVWGAIKTTVSDVVGGITLVINGIVGTFKSVWNAVASAWNHSVGTFSFSIPSWVPGLGGDGFDMPNLPVLAAGGVLTQATTFVGGEYPGARFNPEIVTPQSIMAATFRHELDQWGTGGGGSQWPDEITLWIEGEPFQARIERNNRELASALSAGQR